MTIRDLSLVQRKPSTLEIDVQATMQAFAKELLSWKDEEKSIRSNRRYKTAIRRVFRRFENQTIPTVALVALSLQEMNTKPDSYERVMKELELHIRFNRGGYLRTVSGKGGGVELIKP